MGVVPTSSSSTLFLAAALLAVLAARAAQGHVGPDVKARARLLRDLSLGRLSLGRPQQAQGTTASARTLIDMSLAVRSVDLDFRTGTFRADGWMSLKWRDARYTWNPSDYDGLTSVPLPFSKVWAPEVILHNSLEEKFIFRQVGLLKHDGRIVYMISVHAKSACQPNYKDFPFGLQMCSLRFGSWVNEQYQVEYRTRPNETVALDDFSSPSGWQVVATKARLESRQFPLFDEPSHTVVFDLAFRKDFHFDPDTGTVRKRLPPEKPSLQETLPINKKKTQQNEF